MRLQAYDEGGVDLSGVSAATEAALADGARRFLKKKPPQDFFFAVTYGDDAPAAEATETKRRFILTCEMCHYVHAKSDCPTTACSACAQFGHRAAACPCGWRSGGGWQ